MLCLHRGGDNIILCERVYASTSHKDPTSVIPDASGGHYGASTTSYKARSINQEPTRSFLWLLSLSGSGRYRRSSFRKEVVHWSSIMTSQIQRQGDLPAIHSIPVPCVWPRTQWREAQKMAQVTIVSRCRSGSIVRQARVSPAARLGTLRTYQHRTTQPDCPCFALQRALYAQFECAI